MVGLGLVTIVVVSASCSQPAMKASQEGLRPTIENDKSFGDGFTPTGRLADEAGAKIDTGRSGGIGSATPPPTICGRPVTGRR